MTNVVEKMERIYRLMEELTKEMEELPALRETLDRELTILDRESIDILHINENVALSKDESFEVYIRTNELRVQRRQVKADILLVESVRSIVSNLSTQLVSKTMKIEATLQHNHAGSCYMFRSENGFRLMRDILGTNYESRFKVAIAPPKGMEHLLEEKAQEAVLPIASKVESAAPAPVQTDCPPVVLDKRVTPAVRCLITLDEDKWQVLGNGMNLITTENLETLVDYLADNSLTNVVVNPGIMRELKAEVREVKKAETDLQQIQRYSRFQMLIGTKNNTLKES